MLFGVACQLFASALFIITGRLPAADPAMQEAYSRLLMLLQACLDKLIEDLSGGETGAPCPMLAGLDISTIDTIPEYSVFGGWSGWYMEIVLS